MNINLSPSFTYICCLLRRRLSLIVYRSLAIGSILHLGGFLRFRCLVSRSRGHFNVGLEGILTLRSWLIRDHLLSIFLSLRRRKSTHFARLVGIRNYWGNLGLLVTLSRCYGLFLLACHGFRLPNWVACGCKSGLRRIYRFLRRLHSLRNFKL